MKNIVVVDLEIQDPILKQEDWDATEKIRMSCCCLYSYLENRYHVFGLKDIDKLRSIIISADLVVSFNGNKFDLPVIFNMPNRKAPYDIKQFDILYKIWEALRLDPLQFSDLHKGYGLNACCQASLNKRKTGNGAGAPLLWQNGEYCKVIDYCLNDVALTKELFDFIQMYGYVNVIRYGRREKIVMV